jgi:hypothetical protein
LPVKEGSPLARNFPTEEMERAKASSSFLMVWLHAVMEQKLAVAATIRSNKQEYPPAAAGEQIVKSREPFIFRIKF